MIHISIEGIDGVGKTTASQKVAKHFGYFFVEKPLHFLFDSDESFENYIRIRDFVNSSSNRLFTSWFYGLSNIFLFEKFGDRNIVTDRHLLSNYCWSGTHDNQDVYDLLVKKLGIPNFTFILYANEKTVESRILGRDVNDSDVEKTKFIPEAYKKMKSFCEKYEMPHLLIDTTNLNQDEVANIIIQTINEKVI